MPVYCYKCKNCESEFEVRHSMSFEGQECLQCKSKDVFRIPSLNSVSTAQLTKSRKVGSVVDDYIKDVKKEVKQEKKRLQSEEL